MATFENPLYGMPPSPFPPPLWTSWNMDGSSVTSQNESDFSLDSTWPSPIYSLPDLYCLPLDNWTDQYTTPLSAFSSPTHSISMGHLPNSRPDIPKWDPSLDAFTASIPSAAPVPLTSSCDRKPTTQCNLQHYPSEQSSPAHTTNHPSPSESDHSIPSSPSLSTPSNTKANRVLKTPIRCWEHSCGGRAFSSLGNYERHLREKSGRAKSFACEQCGQRFTRSTAKNKHVKYGRCRVRSAR
ncbi:hypothetical protein BJX99DRAFT_217344 [Aspergillus californicus]